MSIHGVHSVLATEKGPLAGWESTAWCHRHKNVCNFLSGSCLRASFSWASQQQPIRIHPEWVQFPWVISLGCPREINTEEEGSQTSVLRGPYGRVWKQFPRRISCLIQFSTPRGRRRGRGDRLPLSRDTHVCLADKTTGSSGGGAGETEQERPPRDTQGSSLGQDAL